MLESSESLLSPFSATQIDPFAVTVSQSSLPSLSPDLGDNGLLGKGIDSKEIVFIDRTITDTSNLFDSINSGAEIFYLEGDRDGVTQIGEVLAQRRDISGVHILSHGDIGALELGTTQLSQDNLEEYDDLLRGWNEALTPEADILLYGCDVAQGEVGQAFINSLSSFTDADIAASDDLTGNTEYGGDDWLLEYQTGDIETASLSVGDDFTTVLGTVSLENNKLLFDKGSDDNKITLSFTNDNLTIRDDDGGFLSAGAGVVDSDNAANSVTLNLPSLSFTDFKLNAERVTFASDLFLNGRNLEVNAGSIIVNSGVTLSTRQIEGTDHLTSVSSGNSGDIKFTVNETFGNSEIIVGTKEGSEANILTHTDNTAYEDGDITFAVAENNVGSVLVDIDRADSKVELNNTTIKGGTVDLRAIAGKTLSFDENSPTEEKDLWDRLKSTFTDDESGGTMQVIAGVVVADSTAEVFVNDSDITATNLNILTDAKATAKINPLLSISFGVGVSVGDTDSTARSIIDSASTINTSGNFSLKSNTENEVNLIASPAGVSGKSVGGLGVSVVVSNSDMTSKSEIQQGATIKTEGKVTVDAKSKESQSLDAEAAVTDDGRLGVAVAYADSDSTTEAFVDGTVSADGNIDILANSEKSNTTKATSKTGSDVIDQAVGKFAANNENLANFLDLNAGLSSVIAEKVNKKLGEGKVFDNVGLSASVAIADDKSQTIARIGKDAKVNSKENLNIKGTAKVTPYTSASAVANSNVDYEKEKVSKKEDVENREYAGAGAIQISNYDTTAKAYIGNAEVDVAKDLTINSKTEYPYEPTITAFFLEGLGDVTSSLPTLLGTLVDNSAEAIGNEVTDDNIGQTFTSWSRSAATGGKELGLGVTVSYFDIDNTSSAFIAEGAKINSSTVTVEAESNVNTVNVAGVLGIPIIEDRLGQKEEVAGVGGTVLVIENSNDVSAVIHDGVKLNAQTLEVDATTEAKQLTIGVSGGKAESIGINGTVSILDIDNNTIAQIDSGATILTSAATIIDEEVDTKKNIIVNATDDSRIIGISGGVAMSKNVGIGFSVGINDIKRNTQAVMGNLADTESQGIVNQAAGISNNTLETDSEGSITSLGDIDVRAKNDGYILGLALAGATAIDRGNTSTSKKNLGVGNSSGSNTSSTTNGVFSKLKRSLEGVYVTVSGEWLDNDIEDNTKAYINRVALNAANINVDATSDTDIWALAGGFALNYSSSNANSGNTTSVGIAGAWSDNSIKGTTTAYTNQADLTLTGNLDLSAKTTRDINALAASGSATINRSTNSKFNGTLAGSVTINELANQTLAYLQDSTIKSNDLSLTAKDTSNILSGAGAVAVTIGKKTGGSGGSIGLSWADNNGTNTTRAYTKDSEIEASGAIAIDAENSSKIKTLSATLGATNQAGAIVASVSINDLDNTTTAYISGGTISQRDGNTTDSVSLTAKDTSSIGSIAGQVAIADKAAVGFAFAWNDIENKTATYIENANLNSVAGNITLNGISDSEIETYAIGGAFASKTLAAAAGSTAINSIRNSTESYLENSNITSNNNLEIKAQEDSEIFAVAGGVAGSTNGSAFGAAVAINEIGEEEKKLRAYISGGTVNATGNILIDAKANTEFFAIGVGAAAANKFSLGGSVSVNNLSLNPTAYIGGGAVVNADGSIAITANSNLNLDLIAGAAALSSNGGAVGIGTTVLNTNNTVAAYIDGSTTKVNAKGNGTGVSVFNGEKNNRGNKLTETVNGLAVIATSSDDLKTIAASGAVSANSVGGAGSATVNLITNNTRAYLGQGVSVNQNVSSSQSVNVFAWDDSELIGIAGAIGIGSTGIAGGVDVGVVDRLVEAYIATSALVNANDSINVNALSTGEITSVSASLGIGSTTGIAGSVGVSVISETTKAYIGNNAIVTANNNIVVDADSRFEFDLVAGSAGFGGTTGVGISAGVPVINKVTEAYIGQNAQVTALGKGNGVLVKTGEFATEYLPIEPLTFNSSEVNTNDNTIRFNREHGFDSGDAVVFNKGNNGSIGGIEDEKTYYVIIIDDNTIKLAESLVKAKGVSNNPVPEAIDLTSASGSGHIIQSMEELATVDVSEQANRSFSSNNVDTGNNTLRFDNKHGLRTGQAITYSNTEGSAVGGLENGKTYYVIADENDPNKLRLANSRANAEAGIDVDITNQGSGTDRLLLAPEGKRVTTPKTQLIKGLAVTATTNNDMMSIGAAGSGAGTAAVSLGTSVYILDNQTRAYIDNNANINQNSATPGTEQAVHIVAGNDLAHLGVAGSLAIGGAAGIGPGANVTIVDNVTEAYIGESANIDATQNVEVEALSNADIFELAATVAGSGAFAIAGSAVVLSLTNKTHAFIGRDTQVSTIGNLLVNAIDKTAIDSIAGSAGIGLGTAGVGASAGVLLIEKDTQAYIGDRAKIDAAGNSNATIDVLKDDNTGTKSIRGIGVQAKSTEDILTVAAAGAGGFFVGAAGAVSVTNIDSDTQAYIGQSAQLNQNNKDSSHSEQIINIAATNDSSILAVAGSLAVGAVGVSGGVDVGTIQNNTSAYIDNGSNIFAQKDAEVLAFSDQEVDSYAVSAAGGLVGIAGSVSVYGIGAELNEEGKKAIQPQDSSKPDAISYADNLSKPSDSLTESFDSQNNDSDLGNLRGEFGDRAKNQILDATAGDRVSNALSRDEAEGTMAFIGNNVTVETGNDIEVKADGKLDFNALTGQVSVGLAAVGGSVIVANIDNTVRAYVGEDSQLDAANNIQIDAINNEIVNGKSFGGQAGVVSLGASVSIIDLERNVTAYLGNNTTVQQANNLNLNAKTTSNITGNALIASISITAAAGATYTDITSTGTTAAYLGNSVTVSSIGNLNINALSEDTINSESQASSGGLTAAGTGTNADITATPTVKAYIGANADIDANQNVNINAKADGKLTSNSRGISVSGGVGAGVSKAEANWNPTVEASIGDFTTVDADNITISALTPNDENKTIKASANPSAGSLLGSGVGAISKTKIDSDVTANVGTGANLTATNDLSLTADAYNNADAEANGKAIGLFAGAGSSVASVQIINDTNATTASEAKLSAGNKVSLKAQSNQNGKNKAVAGAAGAIADGGSNGNINITNNTVARLGDRAVVNPNETIDTLPSQNRSLEITATSQTNTNNRVEQEIDGLGANNNVKANTSINSSTRAEIGEAAEVKVNSFTLDAKEEKTSLDTSSDALTRAAGSDVQAESNQYTTINTKATISKESAITALDEIKVSATQNLDKASVYSEVDGYGLGTDDATARNILNATAEVAANETVNIATDINTSPNINVSSNVVEFSNDADDDDSISSNDEIEEAVNNTQANNNFNPAVGLANAVVDLLTDEDDGNTKTGDISLREAIKIASPRGTISFSPDLANETITLTQGQLLINKDLTIEGNDRNITISGNNSDRIFEVKDNESTKATVLLSGLTLTQGYAKRLSDSVVLDGGAIWNDENLTLQNVTITQNKSDSDGGGIYNSDGTLTLEQSTIIGNTASYGGGIALTSGTVSIANSSFENNSASSQGGAIRISNSTVAITDSNLTDNTAVDGGAIAVPNGTLTITGSNLTDNIASDKGGAIDSYYSNVTTNNSSLINNTATNGGAIAVAGGEVTLSQGTLSGNSATNSGGGIFVNTDGTVNINNSTVTQNTAASGSGANGSGTNSQVNVLSSIIAGNANNEDVVGNTFVSQDYNLIGGGNAANQFGTPTLDTEQNPIDGVLNGTQLTNSYIFLTDSVAKEFDATSGNGLPDDGVFAANADHPEVVLGYGTQKEDINAVQIFKEQSVTHNLSETERDNYQTLHLLTISTQGTTEVEVQLTYSDGSTSSVLQTIPDWFDDSFTSQELYYLANGLDRVATENLSSSGLQNANDAAIFGWRVNVDAVKTLEKITVVNRDQPQNNENEIDNSNLFIFGMTGETATDETIQLDISNLFNKDVIANKFTRDKVGVNNPQLAPLAQNEAGTFSHSLLEDSPAIDAGGNPNNLQLDQRDIFRVNGSRIDIGAYELQKDAVVVDTVADGDNGNYSAGNLSLREALAHSESGTTITFSPDLANSTIGINEGELVVDRDLTIDGGDSNITIDAINGSRVFRIDDGDAETTISVTMQNLTVTGGNASDNGGGILNQENLTIIDSEITNNFASEKGGGIANDSGTLEIANSRITDNSANSGSGGGIANLQGNLTLNTSTIANNSSFDGGGIDVLGGNVSITNSTIYNNYASAFGGGIRIFEGDVNLENITISGNFASTPPERSWDRGGGGGIHNFNGNLDVSNSTITNNYAYKGFYALGGSGLLSAQVRLEDFVYTYPRTNIVSSIVAGNRGSNNIDGYRYEDLGNNLLNIDDPRLAPLADNGGSTLTHALLADSPAINAGSNPNNLTTDQRGLPRVHDNSIDIGAFEEQTLLTDVAVVDTLTDEFDGDFSEGDFSLREAIAGVRDGGTIAFAPSLSGRTITLSLGQLTINKSLTIQGFGDDRLTIDADRTGRIFLIDDGNSNSSVDVTIEGLNLVNGLVIDDGGAILNRENLTINNSNISDNTVLAETAPGFTIYDDVRILNRFDGGAIFSDGNLNITQTTLSNNETAGHGGAIAISGGILTLENSSVSNNSAELSGGGIYATQAQSVQIEQTTISQNTAAEEGGGIANFDGSSLTVSQSTISDNEATNGGGIRNHSADVTIDRSTLFGNRVQGDGGGINNHLGNLTITNSTISDNYSLSFASVGGGITNSQGTTAIFNSTITRNEASFGAGIGNYRQNNAQTTIVSSIVADNFGSDLYIFVQFGDAPDFNNFESGGNNLIGFGNVLDNFENDFVRDQIFISDPRLDTLQDNGGSTFTHALLPDSPAIDAGSNPQNLSSDQRGVEFSREAGFGVDVGAFEVQEPLLGLTFAETAAEGETITATVTRFGDNLSGDLIVQLSSSDTSEVNIPATVTIPDGSASVTFTILGTEDGWVDYGKTVLITAEAEGYASRAKNIEILDRDVPTLTWGNNLTEINENEGSTTLTVRHNIEKTTHIAPIALDISLSDSTLASTVTSVEFTPGENSTNFTVEAIDNLLVDEPKQITVAIANSEFVTPNPLEIAIVEDDVPTFTVNSQKLVIEGGSTTAIVSHNLADLSELEVTLDTSNSNAATVPNSIVIPAGTRSTEFTISGVDDQLFETIESVSVIVSRENFVSDTDNLDVVSNEVPVTNLADVGSGSFREAIELSNSFNKDFQIAFAENLSGQRIDLTESLVIKDDVAIFGSGITIANSNLEKDTFIIDDNNTEFIDVTLEGLTITGGRRGIVNLENLTFNEGTITGIDNQYIVENDGSFIYVISNELEGGAIYNNTGRLTIANSTLTNNDTFGMGAGIYNESGALKITNTNISNNFAGKNSNFFNRGGGGIYNQSGTITLTNSILSNNISSKKGGAIQSGGTLILNDTDISNNSASDDGGGIFIDGVLEIKDNSTITSNTTQNLGGGIYADDFSTVNISNSSITFNTAEASQVFNRGGGGIQSYGTLALIDSEVKNNSANSDGGGILVYNGNLTLTNTQISDNSAVEGGGVLVSSARELVIYNSEISRNTASQGAGLLVSGGTFTLNNTQILDNVATSNGGGIRWQGGNGSISQSNILRNSAVEGGGIYTTEEWSESTLTITDSSISNNIASQSGGGIFQKDERNSTTSFLNVLNSTLAENTATQNGGGVYVTENITLSNSTISSNEAGASGGAIFGVGNLKLANSTVTNNSATSGSGLMVFSADVELVSSIIAGNQNSDDISDRTNFTLPNIISEGNNLIGGVKNTLLDEFAQSDRLNVENPQLAPLAYNGGTTLTHAPLEGSLAINTGSNPDNLDTDQRGLARQVGSGVDVGAFELQNLLEITFASSGIAENGDATQATITRFGDTSTDLEINLVISDPTVAEVAENTVTILAGENSATFNVLGVDNDFADGTRTVTITASATDFVTLSDTIYVTDEDTPLLTLTIDPSSISEAEGTAIATISTNTNPDDEIVVNLSNSDSDAIDIPDSVTIPADENSVSFTITGVNNEFRDSDGFRNATITASIIDYFDVSFDEATQTIMVLDDGLDIVGETTLVINNLDSGRGSLRYAIEETNKYPGQNTILFAPELAEQTITLTSGELEITDDLIIKGLGANQLTISGNNSSRIFQTRANVVIENLFLTQGRGSKTVGGGAIVNRNNLTIINSTISQNSNEDRDSAGGGITSTGGTLTIKNSTISDNSTTGDGGGIYSLGNLNLTSVTVSGNNAGDDAGGIDFRGGSNNVFNSTITNNQATDDGGGIRLFSGWTNITSSIISGNSGDDISDRLGGGSNNLIGSGRVDNFDATNNLIGIINPQLSPLQDNGGSTPTHIPLSGSPAIDAGSNPQNLTTDQRGASRVSGLGIDIGAVEFGGNLPPTIELETLLNAVSETVNLDSAVKVANIIVDDDDLGTNNLTINGADADLFEIIDRALYLKAGSEINFRTNPQLNVDVVVDDPDLGTTAEDTASITISVTPNTLEVDTLADENDGDYSIGDLSIREAIQLINDGGTISFASNLTGQTLTLTQGQITIDKDLTINGNGIVISGNNSSRILLIDDGQSDTFANVSLNGLGFTQGFTSFDGNAIFNRENLNIVNSNIFKNTARYGGGILNKGNLNLLNSTIYDNQAEFGGGIYNDRGNLSLSNKSSLYNNKVSSYGGGVYNNRGNLNLLDTTVYNNHAEYGGGVWSSIDLDNQSVLISNSTFSGNFASDAGGGIRNREGKIIIRNSTITNNTANNQGSGIASAGDNITSTELTSTIIAGNGNNNLAYTGSINSLVSNGYNLIGIGQPTANINELDKTGIDNPQLTPLQDNGAGILTHALLPNSPAIDAGSNPEGLTTDGRGYARTQGNNIDIGAIEMQPVALDLNSTTKEINNTVNFIEDGTVTGRAIAITSNPTLTDLDLNDFITSITVTLTNRLDDAAEGLSVDGAFGSMGTIQFNNVAEINLTNLNATHDEVENLLKAITYNNSSDTPNDSDRTINITVSDGIFTSPVAVTTVTVTPTNDAPTIDSITVSLDENSPLDTTVATVTASDPDSELTYGITSNSDRDNDGNAAFAIDSATGEITVNDPDELDFETVSSFDLGITVSDSEISTNGTVTVNLTDINESPTLTLNNTVTTIAENTEIVTPLKVADINIVDDALGTNNLILLGADADLFEIVENQLFIKSEITLDYETQNQLQVTVAVDDDTLGTAEEDSQTLTITIADITEFPEINLKQGTTNLASGTVHNFGTLGINSGYSEYSFIIENTGKAPLNISNLTLSGNDADEFSLVGNIPTGELAINASTTLTIRFTPTTIGESNAVLTILNNDSDENTYTLNLNGSATDTTNITGTDGNDTINSQEGDNIIDAGTGDDIVNGGTGGEYVNGGDGDDVIDGKNGNDRLNGDGGNDFLIGGIGNDFLRGGDNNDTIFGGEGNDYLIGDDGDDYLDSGSGSDRLRGGRGSDTFVIGADRGTNIIYDFDINSDRFELDNLEVTQLSFEDNGSYGLIKIDSKVIARIRFVTAAQLQNYFQN